MRIGVYTNLNKDGDLKVTRALVAELKKLDAEILVDEDLSADFPDEKIFREKDGLVPEMLITVGGDGTILRIAKWCAGHRIPVLGVNLGKVGFLTEVEKGDLNTLAKSLPAKRYAVERRAMLETRLNGRRFCALNEFVISRKDIAKMITLDVEINGQRVDTYFCDGFIVGTPTGSTAYSLSAGGPVISPKAKVLALTPVNSHSLHSRPIIIGDDESVGISVSPLSGEATVTGDGTFCGALLCGEKIRIGKSTDEALFIRLTENNFYSRLLEKLNIWSFTPREDK